MTTTPCHTDSTFRLLRRAYPVGIPDEDFFPLARLLVDAGIQRRTVAEVFARIQGGDYLDYLYEVGPLLERLTVDKLGVETVRRRLEAHGYVDWTEGISSCEP